MEKNKDNFSLFKLKHYMQPSIVSFLDGLQFMANELGKFTFQ